MISLRVVERFYGKVDFTPGQGPWGNCHLWIGALRDGYGHFWDGQTVVLASRFAFYLDKGSYPVHNCLHTCDMPACCNPDHLYDGTHSDNTLDSSKRGRHHNAKLNPEAVRFIRDHKDKKTGAELADHFGVSHTSITDVLHGKTYKWVD